MSTVTILELASQEKQWSDFLQYKIEKQHLTRYEEHLFRDFLKRKAYEPLCLQWKKEKFPSELPVKQIINKAGTSKKRIVYSFEGDVGIFLKFVAYKLHRYDMVFAPNCYAFRKKIGVKEAIGRIRKIPGLEDKYCLKLDVSNYFNSINTELLLQKMRFVEEDDPTLYRLFERILLENRVRIRNVGYDMTTEEGEKIANNPSTDEQETKTQIASEQSCQDIRHCERIITESHGAMAGIPLSAFFANIYLSEMDWTFYRSGDLYFRYSDDILLFADDPETLYQKRNYICEVLRMHGLSVNPEKVSVSRPGESWEFLGFSYMEGRVDLSANTVRKMKAKIHRKADSLRRWQRKKGLPPEKAAVGLIKAMNRKFYGREEDSASGTAGMNDENDFTWSKWFFPNINSDRRLKELDAYFQEYIRYAVTGRHYKGNYRIRYDQLKEWGYRSLVNEYYRDKSEEQNEPEEQNKPQHKEEWAAKGKTEK